MKKILAVFSLFAVSIGASASDVRSLAIQGVQDLQLRTLVASARAGALLDWKVGDQLSYKLSLGGFPLGDSVKEVLKVETDSLWFRQKVNAMIQKMTTDIQINTSTGEVLQVFNCGANVQPNVPCTDGQAQSMDAGDIEIISQEYTKVTVPAGTFDVIYIKAKSKDSDNIEAWINPRDIPMDGTAKQSVAMQFGQMVLELTSFKRGT